MGTLPRVNGEMDTKFPTPKDCSILVSSKGKKMAKTLLSCPPPVSMLTDCVPLTSVLCPGLRGPGFGPAGVSEQCGPLLPWGPFGSGTFIRKNSRAVVIVGDVKGS